MLTFFFFRILKTLEARNAGVDIGYTALFWVIALGLNKIIDAVVQSFLYWLCFFALNIPVRSQLSAVVFRKTLLKKDTKGSQKVDESKQGDNPGPLLLGNEEEEDEDDLKNLKQGKINLLAIDATRIADVAAFSNIFAESLFGVTM